jgi:[glutamine synthetase] adenylyltransferase / [glutamine synthetase]-adenylyl-L-tyrosine phosphorylase
MSFIDQFAEHLKQIPTDLREAVQACLEQFGEKIAQQNLQLPEQAEFHSSIVKVYCYSQFVANTCVAKPRVIIDLTCSNDLFSASVRDDFMHALHAKDVKIEAELMTVLRQFRTREMIRIAWRDLAGWADLQETLLDLTALAETCIQFALDFLYQRACARYGTPVLSNGTSQQLVVLGMGKLGAWELNYSSDIDLIFAYAEDGVLSDRKATTYNEFFSRLCRKLVKMLDEVTVDGFVFRTDTRLRPFGESGPIVMTFDGMENYYQTQAREWERYAMIKARQVAGDASTGPQLMALLKPFVYRRYLDYGAFEELRNLKLKITQELQRKDRMDNVKLGPGGIREIEFIGQAFQLIRGGQEKTLQQREILKVLAAIGDLQLLEKPVVADLQASYCFLRKVENHIQQYQDRQSHDLPVDKLTQLTLALSMGYSDWKSFKEQLDNVRKQVQEVFDHVFSLSIQSRCEDEGQLIWAGNEQQAVLLEQLQQMGFKQPQDTLSLIEGFKKSIAINRLTAKGAAVVDRLMPQLLTRLNIIENPDETLKRVLFLIEAVAGRNVYLALLAENPDALVQLIKLSSASPWICDYLSRYPLLFDELLDTRSLYEPLNKEKLQRQLQQQLQDCGLQDIEQVMSCLRKFKQLNVLRVAAADIMSVIPITVVSDYLTYIAEVILVEVVDLAWGILTAKHGKPLGTDRQHSEFGVAGFGKLGGIEFGYSSDMDLVFLYDCQDGNALTDGVKPLSNAQFYGRLGQKIMHILNTKMLSGILYEVDMRLRPGGNSGLLVSQITAYERYMQQDAWTWEHQALVRGRFIAGDDRIQQQFARIRRNILCQSRDIDALKAEIRAMRQKMRDNLAVKNQGVFDLKQSKGGIADIEFIVQFNVLAHAWQNQKLIEYTDNLRQIDELLKYGIFTENEAELLKQAYCVFRDRGHRESLQGNRALAAEEDFAEVRSQVEEIWQKFLQQ